MTWLQVAENKPDGTPSLPGLALVSHVRAHLVPTTYATGVRVSDVEMATLNIHIHPVCPQWNYTISPRRD